MCEVKQRTGGSVSGGGRTLFQALPRVAWELLEKQQPPHPPPPPSPPGCGTPNLFTFVSLIRGLLDLVTSDNGGGGGGGPLDLRALRVCERANIPSY